MHRLTILTVLSLLAPALAAQQTLPDSLTLASRRNPLVRWPEALGFVAVAGITFASDRSISRHFSGYRSGVSNAVADLGNGIGDGLIVYNVLALGALGGKLVGSESLFGVSWRALKSTALAGAGAIVLKTSIGRQRPFQSPNDPYVFKAFKFRDNSFPSGHTAVAFALATSFAAETRDQWSDVVFFGLATLTAYARMHYDKHWASDTVEGAGVGILSARLIHRNRVPLQVGPGGVALTFSF